MLVRVRLTRDGKVRVKVSGRRRKNFEVLFLDKYRRKAFRNLRFVLERLNINIVKEKPVKRIVNINYEDGEVIHTHQLEVEDKVLHTLFNPPPEIQGLCSSLKCAYPIIFRYDGRGIFTVSPLGKLSKSEEEDIEKFVTYVLKSQYNIAFIVDSAHRSGQTEKELETEENFTSSLNEDEIKSENTNKPKEASTVEAETTNERKKHSKKAARNDLADQTEETLTVEEMKEKIRRFQPESFRESVAYERYLQALSSSPEKEEEIHRVFYKLVVGRKDFKGFYRKSYAFAPKLLEQSSTMI